jgi:hypothetical protein
MKTLNFAGYFASKNMNKKPTKFAKDNKAPIHTLGILKK